MIQDFREKCVSRSLTHAWKQKFHRVKLPREKRKPSCLQMWWRTLIERRLNAGFSKVCEIFKVCAIESLKYIREFHTHLLLWRHFHAPETECSHILQNFNHQSEGLATQDYVSPHISDLVKLNIKPPLSVFLQHYCHSNCCTINRPADLFSP